MKKNIFLSLLSGLLLILSFPKYNLWIFAWVGFVSLFFALEGKSRARAFLLSYITGVIFWLGIIYWLIHVTLGGMIILVLYLALYFGIFGLIISTINYELLTTNLLFIPSLWVLLEYLRGHLFTGFPWALLGYSQYLNLPVIQIADITGVWGVSFVVVLINVFIYRALKSFRYTVSNIRMVIIFLIILSVVLGYGFLRLGQAVEGDKLKISVIQGNIPQELKWAPGAGDFIIDRYFTLTHRSVEDNPDLIIWPEAAFPGVLEKEPVIYEKIKDFVKEIKIPLLLGSVTFKDNLYYNSALLISSEGKLLAIYDKFHLVPFGEYIPLRKTFRFLETVVPIGDFAAGREYTIFKIPNPQSPIPNNFGVLICFEDLFPEISQKFSKKGADFIINITNDAWFKRTSSPYQHLQASVFRAVENRRCLVRAANTGISGFIAPWGKIISLIQDKSGRYIFIDGYDTQEMDISKKETSFYTKYGDIFILICFILSFVSLGVPCALPRR